MTTVTATTITKARQEAGMSRRQVARVAGMCPAAINYIEAGERLPSESAATRIAKAVGMDPAEAVAAVEIDRRERDDGWPSSSEITMELIAAIAEEEDTEDDIARRLGVASTRGRRVVERRLARMRTELGITACEPTEAKMESRRAGVIVAKWKRRFSELTREQRGNVKTAFKERLANAQGTFRERSGNVPGTRSRRGGL